LSKRPTVVWNVAADRESLAKSIGQFFARLYSPTSDLIAFHPVVRFPPEHAVTSGQLTRAVGQFEILVTTPMAALVER
jgi:hypothetical protein